MAAAVTAQTSGLFQEYSNEHGIKPIPVAHHVITDGDLNNFYKVSYFYYAIEIPIYSQITLGATLEF